MNRLLKKLRFPIATPFLIYWLLFLLVIFIFLFFVPPFQKPDEQTHFLKAMALSKGQFQCKKDKIGIYFALPDSIVRFPDEMRISDILMRPNAKFPIGLLKGKYPFRGDTSENHSFRYCIAPSLGYVPYALGALLSYPFDNLLITFYFMRSAVAILFILSVVISASIIPKRYRIFLLFFVLNPMILHQMTAISYDSVSFALGVFLFSYFCSLSDKKRISYREFFAFLFLTIFFSIAKYGYYFAYLLPFILLFKLPIKKMGFIAISMVSIVIMAVGNLVFADNAATAQTYVLHTEFSPYITILTHYPMQFLSAVVNTVFEDSASLIQGVIGNFGWQDYTLSPFMTYLYVVIGGCVLYITIRDDKKTLSLLTASFLLIALGLNCLLIFSIFYVMITPIAYYRVFGMQGRHLLIFVPFFVYAMSQIVQNVRHIKSFRILSICLLGIIFAASIVLSIYDRYFYYGRSFSNPDALGQRIKNEEISSSLLTQIPITNALSFVSMYPIDGEKIGGFQLLVLNRSSVSVPYQYFLKDMTCTRTLRSGFLDSLEGPRMSHLVGEKDIVYTQYIPVTSVTEKSFCLELQPLYVNKGTPLTLLGDSQGIPILEYLSIIK